MTDDTLPSSLSHNDSANFDREGASEARRHIGAAGAEQSSALERIITIGRGQADITVALRQVAESLRRQDPTRSTAEVQTLMDTARRQLAAVAHLEGVVGAALRKVTTTPVEHISAQVLQGISDTAHEQLANLEQLIAEAQDNTSSAQQVAELERIGDKVHTALQDNEMEQVAEPVASLSLAVQHTVEEIARLDLESMFSDLTDAAARLALGHLGETVPEPRMVEGVALARSLNHIAASLARSREERLSNNRDLEGFARAAAHDLQEPLRTIGMYASLFHHRYAEALDDQGRQYLEVIQDALKRERELVHDLLEFARLGAAEPHRGDADANLIVTQVIGEYAPLIAATNATVTIAPLPMVHADSVEFLQLWRHLIGNALKFRRHDVAPVIEVRVTHDTEAWQFVVEDNGIGFDQQYAERVFGMMERLHTTLRFEGSGLGLAICKKIVERAGGRLWVESTLGSGSTFHFTWPK
ncbi:sensor histidine kinase [Deinococcus peraridilitoris]|uniref:histidine kinase n=1 Tax=Deinococcus peraridilitoris (strain DSM 19664 / LMG 22246 / CIP 109416 / KR-200) TaxID=937777 RepID=K9ZZK5_DEIPD|nr:ATP-binding protein [Deinococcus peraridilitoris]AFZ67036.1 bacteriophytochrome (light-regulated signal transduction histidine kinase) [Deinococcus peraridilitoris DSM 19664]